MPDVGHPGGQLVTDHHAGCRVRTCVAERQRVGDRVADHDPGGVDALGEREVGAVVCIEDHLGRVVLARVAVARRGIRVREARGGDLGRVDDLAGLGHRCRDPEPGRVAHAQVPDRPVTGRRVVGAASVVGDVRQARRQLVVDHDAGRRVRAIVGDRQREHGVLAVRNGGRVCSLRQPQVGGRWCVDARRRLVVVGVRVLLHEAAEGHRVRRGARRDDAGVDVERGGLGDGQVADRPVPVPGS